MAFSLVCLAASVTSLSAQVRFNTRAGLPGASLNQPYSTTLVAAGGTAPYSYALASGTLPAGIALSSGGVLSGTPTAQGSKTFTVKVTDAANGTATKAFTLDVLPALQYFNEGVPQGAVGQPYDSGTGLSISGGTGIYATSVYSGQMPPGLRVELPTGRLFGTPTTAGTYNFSLRAYDTENRTAVVSLTIVIQPAQPLTAQGTETSATVGTNFQQTLTANGGYVPYTWSIDPATLPQGLILTSGGSLEGVATNPGHYTFTATVTDGSGATATAPIDFTVFTTEGLAITTTALPGAVQNTPYSVRIFVSGASDSGTQFSIVGGTLPSGQLSFSGGGVLHGTITAAPGLYTVTIKATDAGQTDMVTLNLSVYGSALSITSVGSSNTITLYVARPVEFALFTSGATFPTAVNVTFDVLSGSLPKGIVLKTVPGTGMPVLSGTPAGPPGTYHATIRATTDGGLTATLPVTFVVNPATTLSLSTSLPDMVLGASYFFIDSQVFSGAPNTGGPEFPIFGGDSISPNYFTVTAGALPPGVILENADYTAFPEGALVGTPTAAGTYSFTIKVTDAAGATQSQAYTIRVLPLLDPLSISTAATLPNAIVGNTYSVPLVSTGGGPPYSYALVSGTLPAGFTVSPAGVISGPALTSASIGTYTFAVISRDNTAPIDGGTLTATKTFTLRVVAPITANPNLPNATSGTPYSYTIPVSGGTPPYFFSQDFAPQSLPAGLSLNSMTGQITGTTTMIGSYQVGISISDSTGGSLDQAYSLTVVSATGVTLTSTSPLPVGHPGVPYSYTFTHTGGVAPFVFTSSGLPAWLTLNGSTGTITGTPPPGSSTNTFQITIKDSQSVASTDTKTYTLVVDAPSITTASPLPPATIGSPYSLTLTETGGTGPFSWTATGLPSWLSLSTTGTLTGTPPASAPPSISFTATVTDSFGATGSKSLVLPINPPAVMFTTVSPLPPATVGVAYTTTFAATGGIPPFFFYATGLPAWLSLSQDGILSGTPPAAGPVTFSVTALDDASGMATMMFTLPVNSALTIGTPTPLPPATAGMPYSTTLAASGGSGVYTWTGTGLPAFLTLSSAGVLSGTPPTAGPVTFTATVTDSTNNTASRMYTLPVDATLVIGTASPLPAATVGVPYMATLAASGGSGGYTWSATGLPAGLTLSSAGVLSGTPSTPGPVIFTATVTDSSSHTASKSLTLPVNSALVIGGSTTLPPATVGSVYTHNFTASGGSGGYVWSSSGLPAWLTLTAAGFLTGTPPAPGPVSFTVTVTDSSSNVASETVTLPVNSALVISSASPLSPAVVGVPYSMQFVGTGGTGSGYTWMASGLPPSFSLSSSGLLSGTPPAAGPITFSVTLSDSGSNMTTGMFTLPVFAPLVITTASPLPAATVGAPYSQQLSVSGGSGGYVWSATGLPQGLSLSSSGLLTGTPPSAGTVTFTATVMDSNGTGVSKTFTFPVNSTLTITNSSPLPPATVGVPYSQQFTASGGSGTYLFAPTGLPTWLTLSPTGLLTGTPPNAGPVTFMVTVNGTVTGTFTLPVNSALTITDTSPLPPATVGVTYSHQFTASGGNGSYTWTASGLPPGFSLSSSGLLTGTPTSATPLTFTVIVNGTVSGTFTLPVSAPLTITTTSPLPSATVGAAYSRQFTASGGSGSYTWTASGLPPGFSLSSSGLLTGTPASATPLTFTVTVNGSVSGSFTLPVNSALTITTASPLPPATVGVPYSQQLTASGGTPPYVWTASGLPAWLNLAPTGLLSGTPPSSGPVTFTATVNGTVSKDFSIAVTSTLTITTPSPLSPATVGVAYSQQFAASGGSGSYTFSASSLPQGFSLNSSGLLTGTPTSATPLTFTVTVNGTVSKDFTLPVTSALTITTLSPLSPATVGVAYTQQFAASGGSGSYTFGASGLPQGFSLNSSGLLTGTPTSATPVTFTVTVNGTVSKDFVLPVNSTLTITTPSPLSPATVGVAYTQQFAASGGTGSYTFTASSLPQGFSLNSSGLLTGTPTSATPLTFTVTVNGTVSKDFTLPVNSVLTITTTSPLSPATVGMPYSQQFAASGGTGTYTWSASGLPQGFSLNSSGLLTGTPTSATPLTFTVTVNGTVSQTFTLPVNAVLTIGTTSPLSPATVGMPYSQQFTASGGSGTYTWSASGLPQGFSLNSSGLLTGTPTSAGPLTFTVTVNGTVSQSFTLPVNAVLTIGTTSPLSPATVGMPYSQQFTASGGTGTYAWSASGLPQGFSLNSNGLLTGTPTSAGPLTFTVTVNGTVSQSFTLPVNAALTIGTQSPLSPATVGIPYTQQFTASGGSGTYNWTATGLPAWLTFTSTGFLTGTPPAPGPVTFTVTVNGTVSQTFTLPVISNLTITTPPLLPTAILFTPFGLQLSASGGSGTYTWTASGLPAWLTLTTTGFLTGTAPNLNAVVFTATVNGSVSQTFTLPVSNAPHAAPSVLPMTLPNGAVSQSYSVGLNVTGGNPPYAWSIVSGALPNGLSLDATTGGITGIPTVAGSFSFSVQVSSGSQTSPAVGFSITIVQAVPLSITSPSQLPTGTIAAPYSQKLLASGGFPGYTWLLSGGALPAGLTLAADGTISGTPTAAQTFAFSATVTDAARNSATQQFQITVVNPNAPSSITFNPLADGVLGVPYNAALAATGGAPPYTWAILNGSIPDGLTFDSTTGSFSGTPTKVALFQFMALVTDSNAMSSSRTYTINIVDPAGLRITTTSLPGGLVGIPYTLQALVTGGTPPYTWQLASGPLGTGMAFSTGGGLTGIPVTAGLYPLTIQAIDSTGRIATASFVLDIEDAANPRITINGALASGSTGTPYAQTLKATGGKSPYAWSTVSGSLPPGLSLDSASGSVSGTPSLKGSYPFTVGATDSIGASATQPVTLTIYTDDLIVTPSPLPPGVPTIPYSSTCGTVSGTAPYNWSLTSGGLPTGLTLDPATGLITGTPKQTGASHFTVTVTDSTLSRGMQQCDLTVQATQLTINTSQTNIETTVGSTVNQTLSVDLGVAPLVFSIVAGMLPPGLTIDAATGTISGTTLSPGTFAFTVQVKDAKGSTALQPFSIKVNPPALQISTAALSPATVGAPYSQQLQTTGGATGITWSLTAPAPAGLSLDSALGVLSGTPSSAGTFSVSVQATDSAGGQATRTYQLLVNAPALPGIRLSGLPAKSNPGDKPTVGIDLDAGYPLPLNLTATLKLTPDVSGGTTDLAFSNNSRSLDFTIPANARHFDLPFNVGTLAGAIQLSVGNSTIGTVIDPTAPTISTVSVSTVTGGFMVNITGLSTTREMKTATFQFTPANNAKLDTTTATVDVSSIFAQYYQSSASFATGGRFTLSVPFMVAGDTKAISALSVTLTNSIGASAAATANVQ